MTSEWISTGEAAKLLGFSTEHMRKALSRKLVCQRAVDKFGRLGPRRWLLESVLTYKGSRPADCLTTGEAAQMLGYSEGGFRHKFEGVLTVYRDGDGWRGWLRAEVEALSPDRGRALQDPIAS